MCIVESYIVHCHVLHAVFHGCAVTSVTMISLEQWRTAVGTFASFKIVKM